jgi:hypothetical protein
VKEVFEQAEKPAVSALPPTRFDLFSEALRSVHRDGHVEIKGAYYSVPPEFFGQRVWARRDGRTVGLFDQKMRPIALHAQRSPVAVGTALASGPPHRSVRAALPHTALTLGDGVEAFAASRTRASPDDAHVSRLCVRDTAGGSVFPSVDRLPPAVVGSSSSWAVAALTRSHSVQKTSLWFAGCSGATRSSDSPKTCISDARPNAFSDRSADAADVLGASRFPCRKFPRVLRVCDCAGLVDGSPLSPPPILPSASLNGVGVPDAVSQPNTWPACAPVNASPAALRLPTHDSGSMWLAGPSSCDSFIHYFPPVFPAH